MIGLVDYDLQMATSVNLTPPNIEIMKLARYYRVEENIFCRLVSLQDTELTGYDKIYFFSESNKIINVPDAFKKADNVIYGGSAFTDTYKPFENSIIDFTMPSPSIYKDFLKQKYQDGVQSKIINHILDDSYYRNYAGKDKLPIPPIRAKQRVFLYDKDFFYSDWQDTMTEIANRKPSTIIRIHPIICHTITDYFNMRNQLRLSRNNVAFLELDIPLEEVNYMLKKYKNQLLADITPTSNIFLTIGDTHDTSFQYYKNYIYKMNLLYAFWSKKIPIKIKYIYPKTWANNPIEHLCILTEQWTCGKTKNTKTLNDRMTVKNPKNIPIEREERNLLLQFYPTVKELFNQNYEMLAKGGIWKL